jgi:hypothetical protein
LGGFCILWRKTVTKEEVIAAIKECAEQLGHVPSLTELKKTGKVNKYRIKKFFSSYMRALRACGLERGGSGFQVSREFLFLEWVSIVRNLGKIPTIPEYQDRSKYSIRPLLRVCGAWSQVPERVLEYARQGRLEGEWDDVIHLVLKHLRVSRGQDPTSRLSPGSTLKPRLSSNKRIYGPPLHPFPIVFAPSNEQGVVVMFSAMARDLGFAITHVGTEYPDCEAMREVERYKWQKLRIEFEFESRNFQVHQHAPRDCDMIVCWKHNWDDCPLEVLELRTLVGKMG